MPFHNVLSFATINKECLLTIRLTSLLICKLLLLEESETLDNKCITGNIAFDISNAFDKV